MLSKVARARPARPPGGAVEGVAQVVGLVAVAAGIWMIYEPAAVIASGLGLALWAQGRGGGGNDGA